MSTIPKLLAAGELLNFGQRLVDKGVLDPSECANRQLFATPPFIDWYQNNLPNIPADPIDPNDRGWRSRSGGKLSAKEQVITLLGAYVAGDHIGSEDLKPMKKKPAPPLPSPVVEWRTAHMRMFGCFTAVDCAILATLGCEKRWLVGRTDIMTKEVLRHIQQWGITPIHGSNYNDFVTNKTEN